MSAVKLTNITTSQLEYLVAAVESPAWKDAAHRNGVSPSALSQGISQLERRLGVRLFDKQGRRRRATPEALTAADHARRVLAEMSELTRWAAEVREGGTGQISIGMIDTAAIHHFGDTLISFRRRHPDLTVRLQVAPSNTLLAQLRAGDVDAVVCVDPDPDDRLLRQPLLGEPLFVYAPPDESIGTPSSWGPWVSFPAASRTRSMIARGLRRKRVGFDVVAESSQPAVIKEMVRLGMGWTVLSSVDAEVGPNRLERALDEPIVERTLTLVRRADRVPTPALQSLLDDLIATSATLAVTTT